MSCAIASDVDNVSDDFNIDDDNFDVSGYESVNDEYDFSTVSIDDFDYADDSSVMIDLVNGSADNLDLSDNFTYDVIDRESENIIVVDSNLKNISSNSTFGNLSFVNGSVIESNLKNISSNSTFGNFSFVNGSVIESNINSTGINNFKNESIISQIVDYWSVIVSSNVNGYYGNTVDYNVYLYAGDYNSLAGYTIYSCVDGKLYNLTTNSYGRAVFKFNNLSIGEHIVFTYFEGDDYYRYSSSTKYITINPTIYCTDLTKVYGNTDYYIIHFVNNGVNISNANMKFKINGVDYIYKTGGNGDVKLNVNWLPGEYNLTIFNLLTNEEKSAKITIIPPIISSNLVMQYKNGSYFKAQIFGLNGVPVGANVAVTFTINGATYTKYTDSSGYASLLIELKPKVYEIVTKYNGYSKYNNITVLSPFGEIQDLVKYCKNDSQFKVKILGLNGLPAGANKEVSFTINGVTYTNLTDINSYAMLTINLKPGTYDIVTKYGDYKVTNQITVLPTIITSDMSMKYKDGSYFGATILDGYGNPYPNQNVDFKINGVTYTYTTDEYGIAKITINLNKKTYSIKTTYNGVSITNSIVVGTTSQSKKTTSIVNSNNVLTNPCTFTIQLKDSTGNILANKSILFKFNNNMVFNKLTDKNGIVNLNSLIPAGDYSMNVLFSGDHYYTSSSILKNIHVNKRNTVLTCYEDDISLLNKHLDFNLKDSLGNNLINQSIQVKIGGTNYNIITNNDGFARLNINLATGNYNVQATYSGDSYYYSSSNSKTLNIKSNEFTYSVSIPNYVNVTNNWNIVDNSLTHNFIEKTGVNGIIHIPVVRELSLLTNNDLYSKWYIGHVTSASGSISYGESLNVNSGDVSVRISSNNDYTTVTYYGNICSNVSQISAVFTQRNVLGQYYDDYEEICLVVDGETKLTIGFTSPLIWNEDGVRFGFIGNDLSKYPAVLNYAYNKFSNYQGLKFSDTGEAVQFSNDLMSITNMPTKEKVITTFNFNNEAIVKNEWVSFGEYINNCGIEDVQSYVVSNCIINDNILEYFMNKTELFSYFTYNAAYSNFLLALSTMWMFDDVSEDLGYYFNVGVNRNKFAVVMSGVDFAHNAYIHTTDPVLGLNFTGNNLEDVYICKAFASLLFGEIENNALGLSERNSNSSLNIIISEILNGESFTVNFNNGVVIITLNETNNYSVVFDIENGLVYDLYSYDNFTYKGAFSCDSTTNCPYSFLEIVVGNMYEKVRYKGDMTPREGYKFPNNVKKGMAEFLASLTASSAAVIVVSSLAYIGMASIFPVSFPIFIAVCLLGASVGLNRYANGGDTNKAIGDSLYDFLLGFA